MTRAWHTKCSSQEPAANGKLAPGQGEGPARGGQRHETAPRIEGVDGADDGSPDTDGSCAGGRAHGTPTAVDVLDGDAATGEKGQGDGAPTGLQLAVGQTHVEVRNDWTQRRRHAPR